MSDRFGESPPRDLDRFRRAWAAFADRFDAASPDLRITLVEDVLAHGLSGDGIDDPTETLGSTDRMREEAREQAQRRAEVETAIAVIEASGVFDDLGYFLHNPDLSWYLCDHREQVRHFVERGWKELRHPWPGFDLWFYWFHHLDPERADVNPLVHHLLVGRHLGLPTLPDVHTRAAPSIITRAPRRICLFAGYDVDGVIDPTVIDYLVELARHADVYYLADCDLEPGELEKIESYTQGRWAIRHGRYDFGSYAMLARDLVGWDVIETYDELLLVNDSGYLVQPLDAVFSRMDATACDWWGLQATYEKFDERAFAERGRPLDLDDVEREMRQLDLWRYSDFIHVGSYFLAYRASVLRDPGFRRRLDTVAAQDDKTAIILKYEIGFSRHLILEGFHLATYVEGIRAYHPVYRESAFELLDDGFPLLKRQFLYENPFSRPGLRRWKDRVLEHAPGADVTAMEDNLFRVAPPWSLHRSFAITATPDGTVVLPAAIGPDDFVEEDRWTPTHPHWWVFATDPRTGLLPGHSRAVLEAVRQDDSVRTIVLTGDVELRLPGRNMVIEPADSAPGQMYALRAGTLLVGAGPRHDVPHPLDPGRHRFVDVGACSGEPWAADPSGGALTPAQAHDRDLTGAVCAADSAARALARRRFPHLAEDDLWVVGLPVLDLVLAPESTLAADLRRDLDRIRALVGDRRLVVLDAIAHADAGTALSPEALPEVAGWAEREDVVLGLRPPSGARSSWRKALAGASVLDLSPTRFTCTELSWRVADTLVSGSIEDLASARAAGLRTALWPGSDSVLDAIATATAAARIDHAGGSGRRVAELIRSGYVSGAAADAPAAGEASPDLPPH